jgi:hypothetical protein
MKYARLLYEDDPFEDFNPQQSIPIEQRIMSRDDISCLCGLKSARLYHIFGLSYMGCGGNSVASKIRNEKGNCIINT